MLSFCDNNEDCAAVDVDAIGKLDVDVVLSLIKMELLDNDMNWFELFALNEFWLLSCWDGAKMLLDEDVVMIFT